MMGLGDSPRAPAARRPAAGVMGLYDDFGQRVVGGGKVGSSASTLSPKLIFFPAHDSLAKIIL